MLSPDLGLYGEQLVETWLAQQNWQILHRRWSSRWGEIDLIAQGYSHQGSAKLSGQMLAFIEVKTRSQGNWDADGLLSITRSKQKKLWTTARLFLARHPSLANVPCRFDIALVSCHAKPPSFAKATMPIPESSQHLVLQDYIMSAFEV
jgi:putative endonuclease